MKHLSQSTVIRKFSQPREDFSNPNNNGGQNMATQTTQFRQDEISVIRGVNYPKIAGRLRLAHEKNQAMSITAEVVKYDENIAVVKAACITDKGTFSGIGMASIERDRKIAPAILELAETRAIARALRFSGYGIEFCSAEEVSHLNGNNGGNSNNSAPKQFTKSPVQYNETPHQTQQKSSKQTLSSTDSMNSSEGNSNRRLSGKQYSYIMKLMSGQGKNKQDIDNHCVQTYGTSVQHLSKNNASSLIDSLIVN